MTTIDRSDPTPSDTAGAVYRAFWRWHFYAGLLILPVLMLMALTGGAYLYRTEIEGVLYRSMSTVEARTPAVSPDAWVRAAADATGGKATRVEVPARAVQAVRVETDGPKGTRTVFIDPADGRVTGSIAGVGIMDTVKQIHSLALAGKIPNMLIELVAGWAIVMVATGVVLWWPRGAPGGVVTVRATPAKRVFWRDLHAVTGLFAAAVILFLAVTGMPWSAVWGAEVRKLTNDAGWGAPKPPASAAAWTHAAHDTGSDPATPWAMEGMEMHAMHHAPAAAPLTLAGAIQRAEAAGVARPFAVSIPATPDKAWSVSRIPSKVEETRSLYLAADGRTLADIDWPQYGPAAKAIQWGIYTHQGQQYGEPNRLLMLAGCVAVWLLGISAITMWWKRRPKGRLAAPPKPVDRRAYVGLAAVVLPLALLYPFVGASIVVVLLLDIIVRRLRSTPTITP
ncbi:MAG: PepSY domain-containing protein [Alphaproteobacteria bacterium]|nr:PepSY domain-containing protein [Alphaproteobacteria bacterium]MBU1512713.1 PepSY domain-containing protein [Alphaproteobacteria bacterium]MBU2096092.1 PepSY domain-containing protein [Alphaproteobacteria bacterium]MBU2152448.1 PepSY domain-containing protein [Alphaproteobacteria bacterium]MBU2308018.1 PepSY domain-containing protein [Alphaproteobacteria bacterium]